MNSRAVLLLRATARLPYLRAVTLLLAAVMASLLLLLVGPGLPPAHAATTIIVNSNADPGVGTCDATECTLREAINAASAGDTINFSPTLNGSTITLSSVDDTLDITNDLTIDGSNNALTISGDHSTGVFCVCPGAQLALKNLTVAEGDVSDVSDIGGGGIYNGGTLEVTNSTFSGNSASGSSSGGGAIFNDDGGTLTVTNSTFSGNSASTEGGAIYNGGALTVTNSTFSGNSASTQGGAIRNASDWILRNTIVANSPSGGNCFNNGTLIDDGYNIEFPGNTCGFSALTSLYQNPLLDPSGLQNNGGPTKTIALLQGSPAIDQIPVGTNECGTTITTDQRGVSRPQGPKCDIGAFEVQLIPPTPPQPPPGPQPGLQPGPQPGPEPVPHHKHKHHGKHHHKGHPKKHKGGSNGGGGGGISQGGTQSIG